LIDDDLEIDELLRDTVLESYTWNVIFEIRLNFDIELKITFYFKVLIYISNFDVVSF